MNPTYINVAGNIGEGDGSGPWMPLLHTDVIFDVIMPYPGKLLDVSGNPAPSQVVVTTDAAGALGTTGILNLLESTSLLPAGCLYRITVRPHWDAPDLVFGPMSLTNAIIAEGYQDDAGETNVGTFIEGLIGPSLPTIVSGKLKKVQATNQLTSPTNGDTCIDASGSMYAYEAGQWNLAKGAAELYLTGDSFSTQDIGGVVTTRVIAMHSNGGTLSASTNTISMDTTTGQLVLTDGYDTPGAVRRISSVCNVGWGPKSYSNTSSQVFGTANYSIGSINCNQIGLLRAGNVYRRKISGIIAANANASSLDINVTTWGTNIGNNYNVNIPALSDQGYIDIEAVLIVTGTNGNGFTYSHMGKVTITGPGVEQVLNLTNPAGASGAGCFKNGDGGGWAFYGYFGNPADTLTIIADVTEILVGS